MINFFAYKSSSLINKEKIFIYLLSQDNIEQVINDIEKKLDISIPASLRENISLKEKKFIQHFFNDYSLFLAKYPEKDKLNSDTFRRLGAELINNIEIPDKKNLILNTPELEKEIIKNNYLNEEYFIQSFLEGIILGNYKFDKFKSNKKEKSFNIYINYSKLKFDKINQIIEKTKIITNNVLLAKDLENLPSSFLTPKIFAESIKKHLKSRKIKYSTIQFDQLLQKKLNGLHAVGRGSENKPVFVILEYIGNPKSKDKVVLIGKGITFDSGGISLKGATDMWEMKADMSGAAVAFCSLLTAYDLNLPLNLVALLPLAENMPSGSAQKPGDIIITASGKSIEVDNTDAEGRIILADALEYATKYKPTYVVDIATLTGAIVVALGPYAAGLFSNNDDLKNKLIKAADQTSERIWHLPLYDDYNEKIKSLVADVKNIGGKWGGAITAAAFLNKFVDNKYKWAHLDIAGTSFPESTIPYMKDYMTGFGVRLLTEFLENETKKDTQ